MQREVPFPMGGEREKQPGSRWVRKWQQEKREKEIMLRYRVSRRCGPRWGAESSELVRWGYAHLADSEWRRGRERGDPQGSPGGGNRRHLEGPVGLWPSSNSILPRTRVPPRSLSVGS